MDQTDLARLKNAHQAAQDALLLLMDFERSPTLDCVPLIARLGRLVGAMPSHWSQFPVEFVAQYEGACSLEGLQLHACCYHAIVSDLVRSIDRRFDRWCRHEVLPHASVMYARCQSDDSSSEFTDEEVGSLRGFQWALSDVDNPFRSSSQVLSRLRAEVEGEYARGCCLRQATKPGLGSWTVQEKHAGGGRKRTTESEKRDEAMLQEWEQTKHSFGSLDAFARSKKTPPETIRSMIKRAKKDRKRRSGEQP